MHRCLRKQGAGEGFRLWAETNWGKAGCKMTDGAAHLPCISWRGAQQSGPTAPLRNHSTPRCGSPWGPGHQPQSWPPERQTDISWISPANGCVRNQSLVLAHANCPGSVSDLTCQFTELHTWRCYPESSTNRTIQEKSNRDILLQKRHHKVYTSQILQLRAKPGVHAATQGMLYNLTDLKDLGWGDEILYQNKIFQNIYQNLNLFWNSM